MRVLIDGNEVACGGFADNDGAVVFTVHITKKGGSLKGVEVGFSLHCEDGQSRISREFMSDRNFAKASRIELVIENPDEQGLFVERREDPDLVATEKRKYYEILKKEFEGTHGE